MMPENIVLLCMLQLIFMFILMITSKMHQDEQVADGLFELILLISLVSVPVITFITYHYGLHKGRVEITAEKQCE